eukprot:scaffold163063_cov31-Tisochrysis_lutea.AAC.2
MGGAATQPGRGAPAAEASTTRENRRSLEPAEKKRTTVCSQPSMPKHANRTEVRSPTSMPEKASSPPETEQTVNSSDSSTGARAAAPM